MNIEEYSFLWTNEKEDYVLVNTEYGYSIVNKSNQTVLSISDEELEEKLIQKMLIEGNQVYDNILNAYNDI